MVTSWTSFPARPLTRPGPGVDETGGSQHTPLDARDSARRRKIRRDQRAPVELLVENDDYFKTCQVDYHAAKSTRNWNATRQTRFAE